ncbi:MAG TPA: asparagine synthase (glutamine-hydrolyzing) [Candidatus Cybelea sp.]|nr:asparagine synthase (glutamine-hydrolyzing) [Candidatus Cybelea sp.]
MCGICGKLEFDPQAKVSPHLLKAMADAIVHRGPDDEGFYVQGQIGLGFRRLSIIDLSGGHQPLPNENNSVWIIFNGEIYNYQELRTELIAKGHIFRTKSDTEVVIHLFEEYGHDCVQRLRGMFAFAIWDSVKKVLFLARDRVGIKPLYYYLNENFLSFGSEIKAIFADPAVPREVHSDMIDRFLTYFYVPGSRTLFRNVLKLDPGHSLVVQDGKVHIQRYWDLDFPQVDARESTEALEQQLVDLLDESVRLHMISDVPVGFLLSGGVDSTAMLSFASHKADKPISSFTIGFPSPGRGLVDERPFARLAAERFGSKHYELSISAQEFASFLPDYVRYMEEPVCEPAAVALFYVSKLASQYVKVLISGEGGDEAFAGYHNYRNMFWLETIKNALGPLRSTAGQGMELIGHISNSRVLKKYGPLMKADLADYYLSRSSSPYEYFNTAASTFYSAEMLRRVNKTWSADVTRTLLFRRSGDGPLEKMLYVDTKTWLPDDLLIKADRMTMANSVELRVPFLDHKVLEFAARLQRNQKVRGWNMKYLLKKALAKHVPSEILCRPKVGFPVPYVKWLRNGLKDVVTDILLDSKSISRGYFRMSAIQELIERNARSSCYAAELFSLVVLELWHRAFIDDQPKPHPSSNSPDLGLARNFE